MPGYSPVHINEKALQKIETLLSVHDQSFTQRLLKLRLEFGLKSRILLRSKGDYREEKKRPLAAQNVQSHGRVDNDKREIVRLALEKSY